MGPTPGGVRQGQLRGGEPRAEQGAESELFLPYPRGFLLSFGKKYELVSKPRMFLAVHGVGKRTQRGDRKGQIGDREKQLDLENPCSFPLCEASSTTQGSGAEGASSPHSRPDPGSAMRNQNNTDRRTVEL